MNCHVYTGKGGSGKTLQAFHKAMSSIAKTENPIEELVFIVSDRTDPIGEVPGSRENKLRAHARHIAAISNDIFDRDVTRHMDIFHISEIDEMPLSHRVRVLR